MRDTTVPAKRVLAAMADYKKGIDVTLRAGRMDSDIIGYNLMLARGHYTLGEAPDKCLKPVKEAIVRHLDYLTQVNHGLTWYMEPGTTSEFLGAAYLAGLADGLFAAHAKCTWVHPLPNWEFTILDKVSQAFGGTVSEQVKDPQDLLKPPRHLQFVTPMLDSMLAGETDEFGPAFINFLTRSWGPGIDKNMKDIIERQAPLYTGKWSFLAAAACRRMQVIPKLPAKAEIWFPRELV